MQMEEINGKFIGFSFGKNLSCFCALTFSFQCKLAGGARGPVSSTIFRSDVQLLRINQLSFKLPDIQYTLVL